MSSPFGFSESKMLFQIRLALRNEMERPVGDDRVKGSTVFRKYVGPDEILLHF